MRATDRTGGSDRASHVRGSRWSLPFYFALLFGVYLAAAAGAVVYVSVQSERDARQEAERDAAFAARAAARQLTSGVDTLRGTVAQLAGNPQIPQLLAQPGACTLAFGGDEALTRGHLDLIRSDGTVVCTSRPGGKGTSYAQAGWLRAATRRPAFLTTRDDATGEPVALATAPIPGRGVVAAFADLTPIGSALAAVFGGGRPNEFLVTTGDGRVIARSPAPGTWIGRRLAASALPPASGGEASDLDGTDRLYGSAPVERTGWRLFVGEERAAALAAGERLRDRQLLIILGGLVVVLAASFLIYRRVAAPMRRLGSAVRSRSAVDEHVPVSGPAEIAALADDVNELISSVVRELRERERAEESYRLLFEQSPMPMCICDVETHEILAANDAAVAAYGYARAELRSLTLADLAEPGERAVVDELLADPRPFERVGPFHHVTKDGTELEIRITSHTVTFGGRPARFLLLEDVGERERFEQRLRQAQRLESLGQLAGGIAHDFNNVLGVVAGFAEIARTKIAALASQGDPAAPSAIKSLEEIEQAGQRGAALTRQLLAFARRETVELAIVDVGEVVSGIEGMLRQAVGGGIRLSVSAADDLWPIEIDPGQLERVLLNLVINARDAMPDGGEVTIDVENTGVDTDYAASRPRIVPGRYVRLQVSDTGVGMDEATIRRAFEPFFTTKEPGSGTGLGLATVYGIVSQAGGRAQIYSEPGHGTTFTALFPVAAAVRADEEPTAPVVRAGGDETILLVEDDAGMRELAERGLRRHGYHVLTAADGATAVELATQNRGAIDLLVTDVVLPKLLGREVAAQVTELDPGIPVIYVTGYAASLVGTQGGVEGAVSVVSKPFSEAELLGKVGDALAARRRAAGEPAV